MNFYKHYIGDYARDTAHLSLLEHGAYRVLLDTYYATEKPLPADPSSLYRICRATTAAEKKAVDKVADQFFPVNGDGSRHNQRADQELADANAYADAQAMRAHMRWHKQGQSLGNALHSHSQKKQTTKAQAPLPDWVPVEQWQSFVEMRKLIRKPMTPRAAELIVKKLSKLAESGHDPGQVLEQSVRKSWQDVFPLRQDFGSPERKSIV